MRLWSVNLKYLDSKGLTALWRESLLARNVLLGNTKGYKNHPQLNRFKVTEDPINNINVYLWYIYNEAEIRGFNYDKSKLASLDNLNTNTSIDVDINQLKLELNHLYRKLLNRDNNKADLLKYELHTNGLESTISNFFNLVDNPNLINIEANPV